MLMFSFIYILLDDSHFSGVNKFKEIVKEEVIKDKAKKKIIRVKNKVFFLRSIMPKLKLHQGFYRYNRGIRQNGISKCNFIWLTNFAFQAFLASFDINCFKKYHTKYKIDKFI